MCFVCDRIKETRVGNNPFFVKELETGYVVIGDYQHFKGYTLFLYKTHVVELFDLDAEVRAKHLYEMTLVSEAVKKAFGAQKIIMNVWETGMAEHIFTGIYFRG